MAEKNGFDDEQAEFWHPDGSGRRVSKEVYEKALEVQRFQLNQQQVGQGAIADLAAFSPTGGPPPGAGFIPTRPAPFRQTPAYPLAPSRWLSLPLVGFGERLNSLTGHPEPVPFFYEGTIEAAQIVGVCQVPDQFIGEHARSDIYLRFGGKIFCTLTPQQVLRRLGVAAEEVAS